MDKNTIIGFGLLAVLFFGYFYFTRQQQLTYEKQQQHINDSLNRLKPKTDTTTAALKTVNTDSIQKVQKETALSGIVQDSAGKEQFFQVENKVAIITFTNKGGQPFKVQLKDFKTYFGQPLLIDDGTQNNISYTINTGANKTASTSDLLFNKLPVTTAPDGSQVVTYVINTTDGGSVTHQYTIKPNDYMVGFDIKVSDPKQLFTDQTLRLNWAAKATQKERDLDWETQQSQVSFFENNDYDFEHLTPGKKDEKKFVMPVSWIALNQQFFVNAIIAKDKFSSGEISWETPQDTSKHLVGVATANMQLKVPNVQDAIIPMQLYYGPQDYKILKSYDNGMFNLVPLGTGIYAFVKYINRGFILPVYNYLSGFISSAGMVIALLTILIRLLISPLTYQSYLSGAKMKLLKPEIEQLKAKYKDDKQTFAMEQMKLYRSAGANPMGGCLPALFQIPIFFALYSFFNSNISLRGQSFLWANDLSSYDSVLNFSYNIPFYGSHVSLFTILAVVTSLLISLYGMANMQDQGNPMMKYMPFVFPVILLGVFNRMPAALTWYYTVSNVITLLIQFVIQHYIIDHKKLLAKLKANREKPKKVSKWQERIQAMQDQNDRLKQMQKKVETNRKK